MKKITFALALLTFGAQAQTFPSPYCDITDPEISVEEITLVEFAGTSISNTDLTSNLVDKTDTVVNVTPGELYTIAVDGNTYGNFDTSIVAFIDWNQNGILDDAGEVYELGLLTNSTGTGNAVSFDITIPADALVGTTRIRITKTYTDETSESIINPCAIEFDPFGMGNFPGYGQGLDFTLELEALPPVDFPGPYCDITNSGISVEEITLVEFAGTSISNTDLTSNLVDKTDSVVNVTAGELYTIAVDGNTYGDFDTSIVAFIDWNQNGILDDAGEVYELGLLTNSTGTGNAISFDITIPTDALEGTTRIRITKTYTDETSEAIINPCAIEFDAFGMGNFPGYGQGLDFTLNIGTLGIKNFDMEALAVYPVPTRDVLNIKYKTNLEAVKIYNLLGQEVLSQNGSSNQLQVNVSPLTAGAYIVKLFTAEGQHNFRIIKQ